MLDVRDTMDETGHQRVQGRELEQISDDAQVDGNAVTG